jgi:cyclophilin family peptidyl-prolyl cis-trans isomerase
MKFWPVVFSLILLLLSEAHAGVLARFRMNNDLGTIDVELFEKEKPITVSNFVAYVKSGAWNDNILHRWIPNFVLQGGSYHVPHSPTLMTSWNVNPTAVTSFPTIPFEKDVGQKFSNLFGTIAMARVGDDTNSASHDWFFNLKDNIQLDTQGGGYTVFGRTLRGTNTLARFNRPAGTTNIYQLDPVNSPEVPVYSADRVNVFWVNTDITVLTVRVLRLNATQVQLSWESVEGLQNILEYTTVIPAVWQQARTQTGTGGVIGVTETIGSEPMRQYRVRVIYPN